MATLTRREDVDLAICHEGRVWLLEFKLDEIAGPDSAIEQIQARAVITIATQASP